MKLKDILTEEEVSDLFLCYSTQGREQLSCKIAKMIDVISERAKQQIDPEFLAYALLNIWHK